jgi:hypothetical protein
MSALPNTRHELFCQYLTQGKSQTAAYAAAGFAGGAGNACTLAHRPEIEVRVAELVAEKTSGRTNLNANADLEHAQAVNQALATSEIDPAWIISELMENVKAAREAGQFAAANKALELLGREVGLFQEKNAGKKGEDEERQRVEATKAKTAIPIAKVNALLEVLGYTGPAIDLDKLQVAQQPLNAVATISIPSP